MVHTGGIWLVELDPDTGHVLNDASWSDEAQEYTLLAGYPSGV